MDVYTRSVENRLREAGARCGREADTLYFGGGTPSLLGADRILRIVQAAREGFGLKNAEITMEANPSGDLSKLLSSVREGGVNRISLGLQSSVDEELALLGRRHTAEQARKAVRAARSAGFQNISLDLMLCIPGQTADSLKRSIAFCAEAGVEHVSAYLLKLEKGTPFFLQKDQMHLPDEEETGERYLLACEELERHGYRQYEISNFSRSGFESRHNLKYWHCEEYLGLGPAAHSFFNGKRFYFPRDINAFVSGNSPVDDGAGGDLEEYTMLALRLTEGLREAGCRSRFGRGIPEEYRVRAEKFRKTGLLYCDEAGIRLTRKGFLVSNTLIGEILF